MKNQIGILGIGAAGSNVSNLFEGKGYTTMYINTSIEDLDCIKGVHKLLVAGAEGAAKDRKKVLRLAMESFGDIMQKVESVITQQYVVVICSAGGGTGSGLSIPVLKYLTQIGKTCIPVMILPDSRSSAKINENAYNACVELMSIQGLGATFLLDNDRGDKFAINSRFVCELDSFINLKNSSVHGNIDKAERKQMLSCPGVAAIGKVSKAKSTSAELVDSLQNGIHAEITSKNAHYLGVSTSNKSMDIESITSTFSSVYDVFSGYSEASSIIIATGMQFPKTKITSFRNNFEKVVKTINDNNATQSFEPLEPLQGLSFTPTAIQPKASVSPRDILLGLMN